MEHFGYLADGVHWGSSFGFLFLFYDKWGWDASIGRRGVCIGSGWGFVGGWLLGCRNSAKSVLQKSELASLKQRTFVKQRRFPPAKNQLPSCRVSQNRCTLHGWLFRAGGIGWLLGSWMSRQRCAGRRGGKAEFPCGLMGVSDCLKKSCRE